MFNVNDEVLVTYNWVGHDETAVGTILNKDVFDTVTVYQIYLPTVTIGVVHPTILAFESQLAPYVAK